ncbi:hypothetical protein ACQKWADRAFT_320099 [Trichoderma austrokoningii]
MTENMRLNPLPAPHPVLSAVAFPRVHADEYPHGDREAYAQCYPRGLPVTYKMIYGVHSQGVAQTYLEDNLPIGFYTNIPPKAAAVISTSNGSRPFRKLDYIQPQRRLHLWSKDEIQAICNSLRKRHWNVLKNMQQPYCWDDLWTYFDAYDLYHNGCLNLWNVINTLWDENNLISVDVKREIALHIGHWADEWLKEEENQNKLTQWKESQGSIYRILNDKDHESLGSLSDDVVPLIASALKGRRAHLLSNKEAEKAEEPAGLITTFRTTGIENWLTGQPVFDGNGLPPHPVSEPHRGPTYPAPCFSQNGKHYFLPPHCFSPPESVQKSAQDVQPLHNVPDVLSLAKSPKPGVVIVNGSNVAKPSSQGPIDKAYQPEVDDETVPSQNDTRRTSSMPEMSSSMMSGDGGHDLGRRKSQLAVENETFSSADARRCSDSVALSTTTGQKVLDNSQCMKREESGAELDNPVKEIAEKKQTEQDALHPRQSDDPEVEGSFPMHDTAQIDQRQTQSAVTSLANSTTPKQPPPPTQRARRVSPEFRESADGSSGDSFKQSFTPPIQPLAAEPAAFYMQPDKGSIQHQVAPHGFPYQSHQFHSAQIRPGLHNLPYREFPGTPQFPPGAHPHPHAMPPSTMPPYNTTSANGSDDNIHPTQQPRQEYFHGSSVPSAHNGYQGNNRPFNNNANNNANRIGHHRGSQSQKSQGYASSQQTQAEQGAAFQEGHPNRTWRRGPPQDRVRQSSWCRNLVGSNMEYCSCTCDQCTERNRSVWVRVSPEYFASIMEALSFLKFSLSSRFGKVDEVYPAAAMRKDAFIVRFESESSVSHALAIGVVMVPEKDARAIIQPVHRSKWIARCQSQQQPRKLPPLPITQQLSPNRNYAHAQVPPGCSLASSHTSTSEPDQHEIPSRPTSASTLPPQVFSSNQRTEQQVISPIDKPQRDAKSAELPAPVEMSVASCQHLASEESREQAVDPTSVRLQATNSPHVENSKKENNSSTTASPSEETVVEKGAADRDSSKLSLPKEALIALPSTPINSTCSSSDTPKATVPNNPSPATGTGPASKSNNGKAKSPSPVVMDGRQHQASSAVGKFENVAKVQKGGDDETKASSDPSKVHIPIKDTEKLPVTTVASSEKHIESSKTGSAQVSIFTEKEIIERKKAWNRIPMPLDPRKSRKTGTAVAPSQQPSQPILNESSDSTTAKTGNAEPHTMKRDQPKSINTGPEQSTEAKESAKDGAQHLTQDKSLGQPPMVSPESVVSTATTAKEEPPQLSNVKTSGPRQAASEEIDAATSPSQATAGENNTSDATNSQMKPRSKWNRNKKSKKRPTLAPLTILQNEGSSQDVSPSVSEAPSLPKEELRADCHMPKPPPAMSESLAHPVQSTAKPGEHAAEPFKGPVRQAMANARSQYPYDTLPRSRHEFRNNAGGSLKVPKKRKGKYPTITSKTFEASAAGRFEPPQPKYAASGQMPLRNTNNSNRLDSVPPSTEPDNSNKRSRLNPLATAFESPQKASAVVVDAAKAPNLHKADSPRVKGGEEVPRENQSPSKFKIMQRSMAAHSSPVKSQQPKEKFVRHTDTSKTGGGSEMSIRQQENRPAEIQRSWSRDKHQTSNERKELVSSKATSPDKMAALDKEDWPSLPGSRIRSATMQ